MAEIQEMLEPWIAELKSFPPHCHLMCPKLGEGDNEDYKSWDARESSISREEHEKRVRDSERRIEVTYWNSLMFPCEKGLFGDWPDVFGLRLESCFKQCPDCVLNWHMRRQACSQKFSEHWPDETLLIWRDHLDNLDVNRIHERLAWAKEFMEKNQVDGIFRPQQFGQERSAVLIAIYEALCCMPYISKPENRSVFQYVFLRMHKKGSLKLGIKDPLPSMTYFLFEFRMQDRLEWAHENWKFLDSESMTEAQFDWAVSSGLIQGIDEINKMDLVQDPTKHFQEIELFWQGFEAILRTMTDDLILSRLRSLEARTGRPTVYELLFRHIQSCCSEGVLIVAIRVLIGFLKKSPKAFWDAIGDAKPNVIADLLFGSPVYRLLLRQTLDYCWSDIEKGSPEVIPLCTSWIGPWLQSLGRDRRYDACEILVHNLFETLAKDATIGEPGQAACLRAGFDALSFTLKSFLDPKTQTGSGTSHFYASAAFDLVVKHRDVILRNLTFSGVNSEGWTTLKMADAATALLSTAMRLDIKIFCDEFHALHGGKELQPAMTRDSKTYWECVVQMFDTSADRVGLAKDILMCLGPLMAVEKIRARKTDVLSESGEAFNMAFDGLINTLVQILGRISELDFTELNVLFADRLPFQVIVGLSVHGEADLAEVSVEVLKSWTSELSRDSALEHMTRLHPEQTISSIIWTLERVMQPPYPWGPIRPLLSTSRSVLQGLADPTAGVLRTTVIESRLAATILRWWNEQWRFVSMSCLNIEEWSTSVQRATMTEFCREIMELGEALIAEDGLLATTIAPGRSEQEAMAMILGPAKDNFRGMENMIRLKDRWLVDVTSRVLCKILTRLRESSLEINADSRRLITDACVTTGSEGRYLRSTNLNDQQRAELLQALGHDDEVQIIQVGVVSKDTGGRAEAGKSRAVKQSKLDAWSRSAPAAGAQSGGRSNRDDVLELSRSVESPLLKQIEARQAKAKAKVKARTTATTLPDAKAISALKESRQREKAEKARRDADAIARARQLRGEGSGSGSTGRRSEIMVHSSDEDSDTADDDEDGDGQLAALSTGGEKPLDEDERRRQQALRDKLRRPVKKVRRQRPVNERRARVKPPMNQLHETILAWDIFHHGNDPPTGPKASAVATHYRDPGSYFQTFFPLLASEAWRSFVTSKDEVTSQPFGMKIASRASVDSFLEATFTTPLAQSRERPLSEGDILVVSEAESPLASPSARHCLARVHLVKIKKGLVEVTYRVASSSNALSQLLTPASTVHAIKITNMTTIEREYAALVSLQYYDLMNEILQAEPSPILQYGEERIVQAMQNWVLNRGQALAVLGVRDNDGFTLIQGPPGTGKTKTIVAMVGSLLSEQLAQPAAAAAAATALVPVRPAYAAPHGPGAAAAAARPKKLLVCAPSNAAVDELVLRLMAGVRTTGGKERSIKVLRLGRSDAINSAVKDVSLDELVRKRLEGDTTVERARADNERLHAEAAKIKEQLSLLRPRLEEVSGDPGQQEAYNSLSRQFDSLKDQQRTVGRQIDSIKNSGATIEREREMRRRQVQQEVLNTAHVLCATLSGSGHDMFRNLDVEFETVIIDEAAQCVELSALIPPKYGCYKCVLVGDPKQLPPTVLSQSAARFGYDQSLFVRMQQRHPGSVHLLDTQYRMHPDISLFPSTEFYEGQLRDGPAMARLRRQPWHASALLGPYRFFDVEGVQERNRRGQSLVNTRELDVAMAMYDALSRTHGGCDLRGKLGIITPYKAQLMELRSRFRARYGEGITDVIEFNTTDAFQGRECDIIIFSCVRASATGGIGFMTDIRRMNVGLTRAKSSLWILGDSRALVQGEFWRKLVEDARARGRYTRGDIVAMFRRPLAPAEPVPGGVEDEEAEAAEEVVAAAGEAGRGGGGGGGGGGGLEDRLEDEDWLKDEDNKLTDEDNKLMDEGKPKDKDRLKDKDKPTDRDKLRGMDKLKDSPPLAVTPRSGAGPPVIHTSRPPSEGKKRPLDSPALPEAKRAVAGERARSSGLMAKFGQKPSRAALPPPPQPKDPSAMSVLGMTPPEWPPARPPTLPQTASGGGGAAAGGNSSKPMNKTVPQVRKKSKPSLFISKKR